MLHAFVERLSRFVPRLAMGRQRAHAARLSYILARPPRLEAMMMRARAARSINTPVKLYMSRLEICILRMAHTTSMLHDKRKPARISAYRSRHL